MELVVFYCSSEYDLDVLSAEMAALFGTTPVVGCTTAGEIGPAGYLQHSLTGFSLARNDFRAVIGWLDGLDHFEMSRGEQFVRELAEQMERRRAAPEFGSSFAFQLIDGLSVREEPVTRVFQHALGTIPLVGGSAGDGLRFARTGVYCDGRFRGDTVVLVLVKTRVPIRPLITQHFVPTERRLVVTAADIATRVVHEIDGRPAALAYAELLGVETNNLDPQRFAAHPMLVVVGGQGFVRSISKALPDGSLQFFCAIDEGMVLRIAGRTDLVSNLDRAMTRIRDDLGEPQLILGFDCVLRRIEMQQQELLPQVSALMSRHRVVGFATYGEQYQGVHVNQTFTGIVVGSASST